MRCTSSPLLARNVGPVDEDAMDRSSRPTFIPEDNKKPCVTAQIWRSGDILNRPANSIVRIHHAIRPSSAESDTGCRTSGLLYLSAEQFPVFFDGTQDPGAARVVEVSSRSHRDLTVVKVSDALASSRISKFRSWDPKCKQIYLQSCPMAG